MKNMQIKIVISDGTNEAKASISLDDYKKIKELHGVNMIDVQIEALLEEIEKSTSKNFNHK